MRVLLVNDDGIDSPGLRAMYDAFSKAHEVLVVAPDSERSAYSHAVSLRRSIRVKPAEGYGANAYRCYGTPADCVRIGIFLSGGMGADGHAAKGVDAVVSGINNGNNISLDTHYSGTVSAAMEGMFRSALSLAVSIDGREPCDYPGAARYAERVLRMLAEDHTGNVMYNLNLPDLPAQEYKGLKYAPLEFVRRVMEMTVIEGELGDGEHLILDPRMDPEAVDSDVAMLGQNYAVLTPLSWDLTAHDRRESIEKMLARAENRIANG